jgi:hypothetical protein
MATLNPTEAAAATAANEKRSIAPVFFLGFCSSVSQSVVTAFVQRAPVYLPMGRYLLHVTSHPWHPSQTRPLQSPPLLVIIMRAIFAITLAVAAASVSTIDGAALSGFVFSCDAHPACIGDGICVATWVVAICAQGCAH